MGRLRLRGTTFEWDRPLVMGIVNRAVALVAEGAGALDVGAQSAITGRRPKDAGEEAAEVVPVVRAVVDACPGVLVSVDTFKPDVARAVIEAGAHLVNDVSGLRDRAIARVCASVGAGLVVMH